MKATIERPLSYFGNPVWMCLCYENHSFYYFNDGLITIMTQTQLILSYLLEGKQLNPIQSLNLFGCFRLAARISDIKEMGYNIETKMVEENGKRFASYKLIA
jgi:hypothetical protein